MEFYLNCQKGGINRFSLRTVQWSLCAGSRIFLLIIECPLSLFQIVKTTCNPNPTKPTALCRIGSLIYLAWLNGKPAKDSWVYQQLLIPRSIVSQGIFIFPDFRSGIE